MEKQGTRMRFSPEVRARAVRMVLDHESVLTGLPRTIRRHELRLIVSLADSTIYEMERRGEFPRRFNLTPRCVVWDLEEVEAWLEQRRQAYLAGRAKVAPGPDVRQRKTSPVKAAAD